MKFYSVFFIFFFTLNLINSQTKVDFKFFNSCNDSFIRLDYVLIPENNLDLKYFYEGKDSILEILPGKYTLEVLIDLNNTTYKTFSVKKNFNKNSNYFQTIEIPKLLKHYKNTGNYGHFFLGYFNCNKVCNGKEIDYYKNGKKRLEAEFYNGKPKDSIKAYDINGNLKFIEIYNLTGDLIKIIRFND